MFRTRDFILIFVTVVFLVMAIGATLLSRSSLFESSSDVVNVTEDNDIEYSATEVVPDKISRADHLSSMREKIAAGKGTSISTAPEPIAVEVEEPTNEEGEGVEEQEKEAGEMLCAGYGKYTGSWSPFGLQIEVTEGARVIYYEKAASYEIDTTASSSNRMMAPPMEKEVVLQLPIRTLPVGAPACLYSDVVGIAQDGSLIRNNEVGLYSVFGPDTLIGYALDGFPIYGTAKESGDKCGGTIVSGQYQYSLSDQREFVLNCFSAPPVRM